ncbi:MAG: DNA polymerase I [Cytophagales bacterium]
MGNKLFLLDTMALLYRAHFALHQQMRTNRHGQDVGALLGFTNTLVNLLKEEKPSHIMAALDMPSPSWRHQLYADYKANRESQPEAITESLPHLSLLLKSFGIPMIGSEGYEADDVIGTLAYQASQAGFEVYIVSFDKDFGQLVAPNISLFHPARQGKPAMVLREEEVLQDWGVTTKEQVVDILGLWGDSSDNIPGVRGIGKKTAQKLVKAFGSITEIWRHLPSLSPGLKQKLAGYEAQAVLSKKLATIITDLPLTFDAEASSYKKPDRTLLEPLLTQLEFNRIAKSLWGVGSTPQQGRLPIFKGAEKEVPPENFVGTSNSENLFECYNAIGVDYRGLTGEVGIQKCIAKLLGSKVVALDTETTGLDPYTAKLLGISLSVKKGEAYFLSYPKTEGAKKRFKVALKPLLEAKQCLKIGQNLKYDLLVLSQHGIKVTPPYFDTMIAAHILNPSARQDLNSLSKKYLNYAPIEITSLIGEKGKTQKRLDEVKWADLVVYACEDADITYRIYEKMLPLITQEGFKPLFENLAMQLLPVLVNMEQQGVAIDKKILARLSQQLEKSLETLGNTIQAHVATPFNIGSPKQLGSVLFEELKLVEKPTKTRKGQYATGEAILKRLVKKHPVIQEILDYRMLKKLRSTYVDALPNLLGPDGRLHTSFQQNVVSTGRLSSSKPNLQNIPIRTKQGQKIREAFIPGLPGYVLLSCDYSQVELRIMAHFAQDKEMMRMLKAEKDIHAMTAALLFQVPEAEVTPAMRRKAKMVNFGLIYGISKFGLSQRLNIPLKEATQIIERYFEVFLGVKTYMEETIATAREKGYAQTLLGRRYPLPDLHSRNATMRGAAERFSINMPIQGTGAEMIQMAMINISTWIEQEAIPAVMILQVHDELVFEVAEARATEIGQSIVQRMEEALPLSVPMRVSAGIGPNWLLAH